jgi:hypothetical protein
LRPDVVSRAERLKRVKSGTCERIVFPNRMGFKLVIARVCGGNVDCISVFRGKGARDGIFAEWSAGSSVAAVLIMKLARGFIHGDSRLKRSAGQGTLGALVFCGRKRNSIRSPEQRNSLLHAPGPFKATEGM